MQILLNFSIFGKFRNALRSEHRLKNVHKQLMIKWEKPETIKNSHC